MQHIKKVKHHLLTLIQQIRMGIKPHYTFEVLDSMGVTFRAQNEVMNLAETTNAYGNEIVNSIIEKPYLFRF
jgi:hypothetical protein